VGALILGAYTTEGRLHYCGAVGAGLSAAEQRRLTKCLEPLLRSISPFHETPSDVAIYARWVHAELVGAVEYRDLDVSLRHPSWKGLRADMDSALVGLPKTTHK
jgi:bifunctional non-homologous end joining protein LigD